MHFAPHLTDVFISSARQSEGFLAARTYVTSGNNPSRFMQMWKSTTWISTALVDKRRNP